jgi:hypothetical protein
MVWIHQKPCHLGIWHILPGGQPACPTHCSSLPAPRRRCPRSRPHWQPPNPSPQKRAACPNLLPTLVMAKSGLTIRLTRRAVRQRHRQLMAWLSRMTTRARTPHGERTCKPFPPPRPILSCLSALTLNPVKTTARIHTTYHRTRRSPFRRPHHRE